MVSSFFKYKELGHVKPLCKTLWDIKHKSTIIASANGNPWLEPVFVGLWRRPGIDSLPGGPVRLPYFSYRSARLHCLAKSVPQNRFLGSMNVYKYGLRSPAGVISPRFIHFQWDSWCCYIMVDSTMAASHYSACTLRRRYSTKCVILNHESLDIRSATLRTLEKD